MNELMPFPGGRVVCQLAGGRWSLAALTTLKRSLLRLSAVAVVAADAEELSEKFAMKNSLRS